MTDTMMKRMEALEAVAEAAEILAHSAGVIRGRTPEDADIYTHELEHIRHLMAMLSTLDALPASPPGEVVEVVDVRTVCLQAINDKLASVPVPRSYEMAHYCMGLEDASLAIQAKIAVRLALTEDGGDAG